MTRSGATAARAAVRVVLERDGPVPLPLLVHPEWTDRFPWLAQGTTWRGPDGAFDLGLFGDVPVGVALRRRSDLSRALRFDAAVHARQVHGARVIQHEQAVAGLLVVGGCDGHITRAGGLLLTVSVADCVPVSIVDANRRTIALLHAGWRGLAAGIVDAGVRALQDAFGSAPSDLDVHLGPAICGNCYVVGPEVHERLGLEVPMAAAPVDLRAVAADRAIQAGVPAHAVSRSALCTRCHRDRLFSHRGGDAGRQVAVLGIRSGHDRPPPTA